MCRTLLFWAGLSHPKKLGLNSIFLTFTYDTNLSSYDINKQTPTELAVAVAGCEDCTQFCAISKTLSCEFSQKFAKHVQA